MKKKKQGYFTADNTTFNGIFESLARRQFTAICSLVRSVIALEYCLLRKIKRAACFRCRSIMKPQTKRSFCLGVFLVIVTLVVLYSYCNGSSVCYTFPLFNGLNRDSLHVKPQAEMVVTSVIVQTKQPFDMGTIHKNQATKEEKSVKLNELHTKTAHEVEQNKATNFTGIAEKLHFHRNRTSFETYLFGPVKEKDNTTQAKETHEITKHLLPPSDIVGKVAEEILRNANISEEEANRELIRVEKVDGFVDREKEHRKRLNKHEHSLLDKVKESRSAGGKSSERKLVRVERVDLTDEDEEEDRQPEKPVKPAYERSRSQERATSSRMKPMGISEDSELAHARRFGKTVAVNTTFKSNTSALKRKENRVNSRVNRTKEASAITPPPFFAKFLNVTAQEREMMDFLHNYTDNSKVESYITLQGNGIEKEQHKMAQRLDMPTAQAHADKVNVRGKRNHNEDDLHGTLQPLIAKLLNLTNDRQAGSENLEEPFNLSSILGKITEGSHSVVTKNLQTSVPDSTALLVRFLQEGSRYRPRMPQNDTAVHTNKDEKIADSKLGSNKLQSPSKGVIKLKETLLELANHIDLSRHDNDSKTTSDSREKKADLMMLKLLLNQSTLQDISAFNLSHVLKEIAGSSLKSSLTALQPIKVKRDEDMDDLGSTSAQSDLKIFRPVADKLGTSKSELVFNTEKKPSSTSKGEADLTSANDSSNTRSVQNLGTRNNNASFSSGSGSGESGDEESGKSSDSDKRENRNETAKEKSEKKHRSKLGKNGILKFDSISCDALDPKVLLYNRIFKTGSSTTESLITNSSSRMNYAYKIGTTEDWYDEGRSHPYPGLIIRKANKKLIKYPRMAFVAHFYFRRNLNLPQAHTYVNQVRHPVRRLVSHYHYMRSMNRPAYRIREFRASGERDETLEKCFRLQHKGCQNNVMTRFFCGRHFYCRRGNGRALHKAMNNIKRFYATVGLLEYYDVYLQILNKRLPKFFPKISNQDISRFKYNPKYSFNNISEDLIAAITRANWADVKLYSFVKKRFWKQAKACEIRTLSI